MKTLSNQNKKIFITHSPDDINEAQALVDLLKAIGVPDESILASYLPSYDSPLRSNRFDFISDELRSKQYLSVFILSNSFYQHPSCLNEMGAIWVLKHQYEMIICTDFDHYEDNAAINLRLESIDFNKELLFVKDRLNQFYNTIISHCSLLRIKDSVWENARDKFIDLFNNSIMPIDLGCNISIEGVVALLKNPGRDISIEIIESIGLSKKKSAEIFHRLLCCGYIKKISFGRYVWL